jgi:hypothetical protein
MSWFLAFLSTVYIGIMDPKSAERETTDCYKIIVLRQSTLNLRWRSGRCWRGWGSEGWHGSASANARSARKRVGRRGATYRSRPGARCFSRSSDRKIEESSVQIICECVRNVEREKLKSPLTGCCGVICWAEAGVLKAVFPSSSGTGGEMEGVLSGGGESVGCGWVCEIEEFEGRCGRFGNRRRRIEKKIDSKGAEATKVVNGEGNQGNVAG